MPKRRQLRQLCAPIQSFCGGNHFAAQPAKSDGCSTTYYNLMRSFNRTATLNKTNKLSGKPKEERKSKKYSESFLRYAENLRQLGSMHAMNFGRNPNIWRIQCHGCCLRHRARVTSITNRPTQGRTKEPRGKSDEGELYSVRSARAADCGAAAPGLRQFGDCSSAQNGQDADKAHFNRLFLTLCDYRRYQASVKLATILYRRQLCSENSVMETVSPASESSESSKSLPRDSETEKFADEI